MEGTGAPGQTVSITAPSVYLCSGSSIMHVCLCSYQQGLTLLHDLLGAIREVTAADPPQHQVLFRNADVLVQLVSLLDHDVLPKPALELCEQVLVWRCCVNRWKAIAGLSKDGLSCRRLLLQPMLCQGSRFKRFSFLLTYHAISMFSVGYL
jgi:hypothetical protein